MGGHHPFRNQQRLHILQYARMQQPLNKQIHGTTGKPCECFTSVYVSAICNSVPLSCIVGYKLYTRLGPVFGRAACSKTTVHTWSVGTITSSFAASCTRTTICWSVLNQQSIGLEQPLKHNTSDFHKQNLHNRICNCLFHCNCSLL